MQPIRVKTVQESDLRMLGSLARNIQRVLPVTQADIDAAAALGKGWVVWKVFEVSDPLDNLRGGTQLIIRQNSIQPGQNVRRVIFVAGPGGQTVVIRGTDYIALPDAIANSLAYVKAFGGTEQRSSLPEGYTQLAYIESTGTQYIDTGIKQQDGDEFGLVYQQITLDASYRSLFGAAISGQAREFYISQTSSATYVCNTLNSAIPRDTNKHTLSWVTSSSSAQNIVVDGQTYSTAITAAQNPDLNVMVFARNAGDAKMIGKVYRYYQKRNGEYLINLVPAKNSNNVIGMYDTVSGQFFTNQGTGTFAAGPEAVPTPDSPMDIVSNNGVLKCGAIGKNLFNENDVTLGYFYNDTGIYTSNNVTYTSGKIPMNAGTTVTFSRGLAVVSVYLRIHAFDSNDNWIGLVAKSSTTTDLSCTGTTPANTSYIRVCGGKQAAPSEIDHDCQVELGSTATEYEPYRAGIYTDGTVETINAHGKNLYNKADGVLFGYPTASYTWMQRQDNTGELTIMMRLKEGSTYTATRAADSFAIFRIQASATSTLTPGQSLVDIDSTGSNLTNTKTFTVPYGTPYVLFYVRNTALQSSLTVDDVINAFQLELGSTATEYVPYYDGGTATAEMLLKVGDYQDVQSILDGVVTRNVGVKVLDGTEDDWVFSNAFYRGFSGKTTNKPDTIISTHFNFSSATSAAAPDFSVIGYISINIGFKYTALNGDINAWKQWLAAQYAAGTPVIIVYPLATATTESVTGQPLQVTDGDNVLEITQASLTGLELEAQYSAAVTLTVQEVEDANLDNNVEVTIS